MEPMTLAELGEPKYIDGESFVVAGLAGEYTPATTYEIPKQWERFVAVLDQVNPAPQVTYGVVYRTQPMRYVCGIDADTIANLPDGWLRDEVPAQRYATFAGDGGVASIRPMFAGLFQHWVPLHADELSDGPMIEFYPERFGMGDEHFEVWLPLKA